ncbi:hypothetical protein BRADI_4g22035v3 [Brachypodium distachyon]|uniref:Uncharacterized protein n=1 Tax=Brachypodium distachyon TaxID=15368 RepID=A0A2K2CPE3_BRADI|nr:hypothetical protein BRADI_4g22035v3 [Brachypodium distachyon]
MTCTSTPSQSQILNLLSLSLSSTTPSPSPLSTRHAPAGRDGAAMERVELILEEGHGVVEHSGDAVNADGVALFGPASLTLLVLGLLPWRRHRRRIHEWEGREGHFYFFYFSKNYITVGRLWCPPLMGYSSGKKLVTGTNNRFLSSDVSFVEEKMNCNISQSLSFPLD